jgi:para-nitrobenzyl esterase
MGRDRGIGGGDFKSLADESGKITREAFKKRTGMSSALASRPEIIDRLFDRLDKNGDRTLDESEYEGMKEIRGQFSRGANRPGAGGGNPAGGMPRDQEDPPNDTTAPQGDKSESQRDKAQPQGAEAGRTIKPESRRSLGAMTKSVRVAAGELVGELGRGESGQGVSVFRGVPYAAPAIGARRWQAPHPPIPWAGIRDATRFGSPALQGETFTPRGEQGEDCLFLNVWAPADATRDSKLPVLFWIHGGAFIQGSGAQPRYDGTQLARRGVVVITINYRLGPLGLFAHPALTAETGPNEPLANYCLLDMIAALRWTRDNIAAFGGDPENVTISGSSAGGTSCLFLMGVDQAEGLFHKAIIHSSGGIKNIQTLAEAEAAGVRLARRVGLGVDASVGDLRRAAAGDLAVGVGAIRELDLPVKPIIDGRLVKAVPAELFAQGKQLKVPVLIGSANGESGARQFGDELATGGAFGFQRQLADQMSNAGQPVWMFQLTYVPPQSRDNRFSASHGETVAYAFGTIGQSVAASFGFRDDRVAAKAVRSRRGGGFAAAGGGREDDSQAVEESPQGRKISDAMIGYWIAFMKGGDPNDDRLPRWPRHVAAAPRAMVFGNEGIVAK